jgi:hypothetical protein
MAIVREASQAEQGLKDQHVVLDKARMGQMMDELTRSPGMTPCAGKLNTMIN